MMRLLSCVLLHAVERFFLWAHGWKRLGNGDFQRPPNYPRKPGQDIYAWGHAINSQKYTNRHAAFLLKLDAAISVRDRQ